MPPITVYLYVALTITIGYAHNCVSALHDLSSFASILNPSQPKPDYTSKRKQPVFPGAVPIDIPQDVNTCINQTGQTAPANALLGKPSQCKCRHGYAQVFSLDPMPSTSSNGSRLNSGILKLTCPLLVSSIDQLEDDGIINEMNSKLVANDDNDDNEKENFIRCMKDAHLVHANARKELVFGDAGYDIDEVDESNSNLQLLVSKLGSILLPVVSSLAGILFPTKNRPHKKDSLAF